MCLLPLAEVPEKWSGDEREPERGIDCYNITGDDFNRNEHQRPGVQTLGSTLDNATGPAAGVSGPHRYEEGL
jgi:hypothetical protein